MNHITLTEINPKKQSTLELTKILNEFKLATLTSYLDLRSNFNFMMANLRTKSVAENNPYVKYFIQLKNSSNESIYKYQQKGKQVQATSEFVHKNLTEIKEKILKNSQIKEFIQLLFYYHYKKIFFDSYVQYEDPLLREFQKEFSVLSYYFNNNYGLKKISLNYNAAPIDPFSMNLITAALKDKFNLREISMYANFCSISNSGFNSLWQMPRLLSNLKILKLPGNNLCTLNKDFIGHLLLSLRDKVFLEELDLSENMYDSDIQPLIDLKSGLNQLRNLKVLNLSFNIFKDSFTAIRLLIDILNANNNLESIILEGIFNKKNKHLVGKFLKNLTLRPNFSYINLSRNLIGYEDNIEDLEGVVDFLDNNPYLEAINLSNNYIGMVIDYYRIIGKCLRSHPCLEYINLENNRLCEFSAVSFVLLLLMLEDSPTIYEIDVSFNFYGTEREMMDIERLLPGKRINLFYMD